MDDGPYSIIIYLKIFVDKEIAHVGNGAPFNFFVSFFEWSGKHVGCLANYFNVFHNTIVSQNIGL